MMKAFSMKSTTKNLPLWVAANCITWMISGMEIPNSKKKWISVSIIGSSPYPTNPLNFMTADWESLTSRMNLKETRVVEATHSMLLQAFYPISWCRFFDKAAVKTDKDENPETPPTPWRLCTITQVQNPWIPWSLATRKDGFVDTSLWQVFCWIWGAY